MARGTCHCGQRQKANGNCPVCREDGLALQCIGPWSLEKHDYLRRYIEATHAVRARFKRGGAAFIDVFAGPGRAKRTDTGQIVDGSPLIAACHARAPFSHLVFGESDQENIVALQGRTTRFQPRVHVVEGDSIQGIQSIIAKIPPHGLNLALVDPFGPAGLRWIMLEALARVQRMDLIVHFPTVGARRNEAHVDFDAMVGSNSWRNKPGGLLQQLVACLKENLRKLDYKKGDVRDVPVKNNQGGVLYHLIFATKNPLGEKIWKSIVRTDASGQRGFGW